MTLRQAFQIYLEYGPAGLIQKDISFEYVEGGYTKICGFVFNREGLCLGQGSGEVGYKREDDQFFSKHISEVIETKDNMKFLYGNENPNFGKYFFDNLKA